MLESFEVIPFHQQEGKPDYRSDNSVFMCPRIYIRPRAKLVCYHLFSP